MTSKTIKLGEEVINNIRLLIREIDRVETVQNIPSVAQKIGISDKELNVLIHKVYDLFGDDIFKKAYDFGGNEFDLIKGNYYSDFNFDEWLEKQNLENQEEEINKQLDKELKLLQIDNNKRAIKFYKYRYLWMFGFALLGGIISWVIKSI